jgi:nitric oxide reductase activation protein
MSSWLPWVKDAESPEVTGEETESLEVRFRQQLGIVEQQLEQVRTQLEGERVDCEERIRLQVQVVMRHYDEENDHLRQRLITLTTQINEAEQILESLKGFVEGWKVGE